MAADSGNALQTDPPLYGIKSASQMSGVSQQCLRAWESRYDLSPTQRSASGRRLYSELDIEKLILIKRLSDQGETIGELARLGLKELRQRAQRRGVNETGYTETAAPRVYRVAVLGDFIPAKLENIQSWPVQLDFVTKSSSIAKFTGDISRLQPDTLIIEMPILDAQSSALVLSLIEASGADRTVVIYGFGRTADIDLLKARNIKVLRAPTNDSEIFDAVLKTDRDNQPFQLTSRSSQSDSSSVAAKNKLPIPKRRFGTSELARLGSVVSTVNCECPHHLVDLVMALSAFEAYSASCENKNQKDAELHAYLHSTTAQARSMMEQALEKVALAEGLL